MKEKNIKNLLLKAALLENKSDLELEVFELILDLCNEKNYKIENFIGNVEECTLCEQQKFMHLVALQDDSILDIVFEYHKTFSTADFCKEDFKSKYELQLLENTFEISL
ncbi:hypothetical protein [Flavobacterium sp. I3-2]|uniref:hypothetical protein n=1 Tax=Flavobacterium sp. I3-2 TaxID=2748319 RepID=UPI0015AF007D|nr:hypothetical protein [Flavobacterium sp. I3-2]